MAGVRLLRGLLLLFALASLCLPATFRLYLKDGTYHLVREYQVLGDRVRYYSTERSEWEEIPLELLDLDRTEKERKDRQQALEEGARVFTAEEAARRELEREISRVPVEPGAYLLENDQIRPLKQAESKAVTNKGRFLLKVLVPAPVIPSELTVEIDRSRSEQLVSSPQPEFYLRTSSGDRFGIFKLTPRRDSRVVQKWNIDSITKEVFEEQEEVRVFRRQLDDRLFKIWPVDPLEPGEYAVVEYTPGQKNIQIWDFAWRPATAAPTPQPSGKR